MGKGGGVVYREGVFFDVEPGNEQWSLVAGSFLGAKPFFVKIVTGAVGGAFENLHRERGIQNTGTGRPDDLFGGFVFGFCPEGDFGTMRHSGVATACAVGFFGAAYLDLAVSLGDDVNVECTLETGELWSIFGEGLPWGVE